MLRLGLAAGLGFGAGAGGGDGLRHRRQLRAEQRDHVPGPQAEGAAHGCAGWSCSPRSARSARVANLNVASLMVNAGHQAWWSAGVVGAAMSLVWNYAVGSTLTWRR